MFKLMLRDIRKAKKLTQKELGDAIGISDDVVGDWERGRTVLSFYDACLVADALGVTLDELAGREKINDGVSVFNADTLRIAMKIEELPWAAVSAAEAMVDGLSAATSKSTPDIQEIA